MCPEAIHFLGNSCILTLFCTGCFTGNPSSVCVVNLVTTFSKFYKTLYGCFVRLLCLLFCGLVTQMFAYRNMNTLFEQGCHFWCTRCTQSRSNKVQPLFSLPSLTVQQLEEQYNFYPFLPDQKQKHYGHS